MGYGKTTAVSEFLQDERAPVLWMTIEATQDAASSFWDALTNGLRRFDGSAAERLKALGFPSDAPRLAYALSQLGEMVFPDRTVLVIDDYHLVKSPQIGWFIGQAVRRAFENLHILIITRDTTNLDFAELVAKGLCNILSQHVIGFTRQETREYCAMMDCMPGEDVFGRICEYTDGWIALIYLILMGLKNGIPVGMNSAINDLVESVLYNPCQESVRQFLVALSVMDGFTPEQAMAVTQESGTVELLKQLRRENAFISFDEATGVYKIHNILLDYLRIKLKTDPRRRELCLRCGEWHLGQKAYAQAYRFFYRAGETRRILSLLDDENNITQELAEFEGSAQMFSELPRKLLCEYPMAYLQYICMLLLDGGPDMRRQGVARLEELRTFCAQPDGILAGRRRRILAEICMVRIFAAFNDIDGMRTCVEEACRLFDGECSRLVVRKSEFTFGSPHLLYSYYREEGTLEQTARNIAAGIALLAPVADGCGTGSEYTAMAEYALETGDFGRVTLNAQKAICKAKAAEQTGIVICADFALARLCLAQGRSDDAIKLMRQLRREVAAENNAYYNTTLDICEGYLYGCLGRPEGIAYWLRTGDWSAGHFLYRGVAFCDIVHEWAALLAKDYLRLEMLTEIFAEHFSIFQNRLGLLHNRIFKAAARYKLYGLEEGCAALQEALDMGRADGILLPFAENAPAILDPLRVLAHGNTRDAYLKKVLAECEQYAKHLRQIRQPTALSPRELEVLARAAEGLSREEIANSLCVSTGTVRTHLQNIYQKLEVGGRTAAVRKAEKLRLL